MHVPQAVVRRYLVIAADSDFLGAARRKFGGRHRRQAAGKNGVLVLVDNLHADSDRSDGLRMRCF